MKAPPLDYVRPESFAAAIVAIAQAGDGAKVLGGGQSLGPMLNLRVVRPGLLVDVSRLDELSRIEKGADSLRIGAAVTHSAIEDGAAGVRRPQARDAAWALAEEVLRLFQLIASACDILVEVDVPEAQLVPFRDRLDRPDGLAASRHAPKGAVRLA